MIDAYARRIVGWRVWRSANADFVLDALNQALAARRPGLAAPAAALGKALTPWNTPRCWFNTRRLFAPIGYRPPAEAEAQFFAGQEAPKMAA